MRLTDKEVGAQAEAFIEYLRRSKTDPLPTFGRWADSKGFLGDG